MSPHESDRRHIERQIAYARPIIALLALIALLEQTTYSHAHRTIYFLIGYFFLAVLALLFEQMLSGLTWHLPLACDLLALGFFMYLSPTTVPAWFPYLFVCYAAGIRWGLRVAFPLASGLALLLVMITAVKGEIQWMRVIAWMGLVGATLAAGGGSAFLGDLSRSFAAQNELLARVSSTMQVDQGLSESLRLLLDELTQAFHTDGAMLVYRDTDLERIFVWQLKSGESERLIPENLPLTRADGFLLDDLDATICWNSLAGAGAGFSWDRRDWRTVETLLSIEIQLDVLRRQAAAAPEQAATGLANLQQTVKNESAELRHMVTDLRPLRVQSADLIDLMRGFAERYRNESTLALDVLIDSVELHAPDRVCREIFQIYREALNNIKKHAKASHVVVKLSQDDSRLALVVDDNGEGFSFAGRFTGDELDRLRLGPISIKERTRTVGGVLTVESNPGHGARLTIEIPLG